MRLPFLLERSDWFDRWYFYFLALFLVAGFGMVFFLGYLSDKRIEEHTKKGEVWIPGHWEKKR